MADGRKRANIPTPFQPTASLLRKVYAILKTVDEGEAYELVSDPEVQAWLSSMAPPTLKVKR